MEYIVILVLAGVACCACCYGCKMGARGNKILDYLDYTIGKWRRRSLEWRRQLDRVVVHRAGCDKRCNERHPTAYKTPCTSHCASCKNPRCKFIPNRTVETHCDGCDGSECPYENCFHPDALIALANGLWIPIRTVLPGTMVRTRLGTATVRHAIHYNTRGSARMTRVPAPTPFWITPYHPLIVDGRDAFPVEAFPDSTSTVSVPFVCNLVLDDGMHTDHTVLVGENTDIGGYTLGHGYTDPVTTPIVGHPYFGNMEAVLADLVPVDETGRTVYRNPQPVRDPTTGLIAGVREAEQSAAASAI